MNGFFFVIPCIVMGLLMFNGVSFLHGFVFGIGTFLSLVILSFNIIFIQRLFGFKDCILNDGLNYIARAFFICALGIHLCAWLGFSFYWLVGGLMSLWLVTSLYHEFENSGKGILKEKFQEMGMILVPLVCIVAEAVFVESLLGTVHLKTFLHSI